MDNSLEYQRFARGAELLLTWATREQLTDAVKLLAFKYSCLEHCHGELLVDDIEERVNTDPRSTEMRAIHLGSKRTIVSALSTLMGIDEE